MPPRNIVGCLVVGVIVGLGASARAGFVIEADGVEGRFRSGSWTLSGHYEEIWDEDGSLSVVADAIFISRFKGLTATEAEVVEEVMSAVCSQIGQIHLLDAKTDTLAFYARSIFEPIVVESPTPGRFDLTAICRTAGGDAPLPNRANLAGQGFVLEGKGLPDLVQNGSVRVFGAVSDGAEQGAIHETDPGFVFKIPVPMSVQEILIGALRNLCRPRLRFGILDRDAESGKALGIYPQVHVRWDETPDGPLPTVECVYFRD